MWRTEHVPAARADRNLNTRHAPNANGLLWRDNPGARPSSAPWAGIARTSRSSGRILDSAQYSKSRTTWVGETHRRPMAFLSHRLT